MLPKARNLSGAPGTGPSGVSAHWLVIMAEQEHNDDRYYATLTRKMTLIVITVSVAPLFIISAIILHQFQQSYFHKSVANLELLVQEHKLTIDNFLTNKKHELELLTKWHSFPELSDETFLRSNLEILQKVYAGSFVDLGVVDRQGVQVAYAGPFKLEKAVYTNAEWFQSAMQSDVYVSDVFLGLRGIPHFIIAIKQQWMGDPWILRATVDFLAFNTLVESIKIGETGLAFIVNGKGELQTHAKFRASVPVDIVKELIAHPLGSRQAVFTRREHPSGQDILYVITPLKGGDWTLIYQQDVGDFFAGLYRTRNMAVLMAILGSALIITTAILISRRMVNRIKRVDREKEMMDEQIIETGKLASLGELAAGIAHEINNPVAIMVEEAGWMEDLLEEDEFSHSKNLEELQRALSQIRKQGKRCKDITHKLLSFARKTDPTTGMIQLNELVEEVVNLSEQRARYANVKVSLNLQTDLPDVSASASEMQQVLLNLINNALDAMEPTGGKLEFTTRVDDHSVVVDVGDNGPGIAKSNLVRIFDPFFTTKPVGKGTGLGLSICYGIIHKMGGDISVNSAVGIGTTFHIRIPLLAKKPAQAESGNRVSTAQA